MGCAPSAAAYKRQENSFCYEYNTGITDLERTVGGGGGNVPGKYPGEELERDFSIRTGRSLNGQGKMTKITMTLSDDGTLLQIEKIDNLSVTLSFRDEIEALDDGNAEGYRNYSEETTDVAYSSNHDVDTLCPRAEQTRHLSLENLRTVCPFSMFSVQSKPELGLVRSGGAPAGNDDNKPSNGLARGHRDLHQGKSKLCSCDDGMEISKDAAIIATDIASNLVEEIEQRSALVDDDGGSVTPEKQMVCLSGRTICDECMNRDTDQLVQRDIGMYSREGIVNTGSIPSPEQLTNLLQSQIQNTAEVATSTDRYTEDNKMSKSKSTCRSVANLNSKSPLAESVDGSVVRDCETNNLDDRKMCSRSVMFNPSSTAQGVKDTGNSEVKSTEKDNTPHAVSILDVSKGNSVSTNNVEKKESLMNSKDNESPSMFSDPISQHIVSVFPYADEACSQSQGTARNRDKADKSLTSSNTNHANSPWTLTTDLYVRTSQAVSNGGLILDANKLLSEAQIPAITVGTDNEHLTSFNDVVHTSEKTCLI